MSVSKASGGAREKSISSQSTTSSVGSVTTAGSGTGVLASFHVSYSPGGAAANSALAASASAAADASSSYAIAASMSAGVITPDPTRSSPIAELKGVRRSSPPPPSAT